MVLVVTARMVELPLTLLLLVNRVHIDRAIRAAGAFTGVLVPLFARNLNAHTLPGFNAMNAALKARAEAAGANHPVVAA